jgi:hypothetical protein
LRFSEREAAELFSNARRIASRYFGDGVLELLQPLPQRIARALLAGNAEEVRQIAEQTAPWTIYPSVIQVGWNGSRLQISGAVQLSDVTPTDETSDNDSEAEQDVLEQAEAIFAQMPQQPFTELRFATLLGTQPTEVVWLGLASSALRLDLTERQTGESWPVPAVVRRMGLAVSFWAEIDPNTLAAGTRLADGLWDLHAYFGVMGLGMRRRVTLIEQRWPGPVLAEPVENGVPTMAAYFTRRTSGLCLDVGLVRHRKLAAHPKRAAPAKKPLFAQRVIRKLRRLSARPT